MYIRACTLRSFCCRASSTVAAPKQKGAACARSGDRLGQLARIGAAVDSPTSASGCRGSFCLVPGATPWLHLRYKHSSNKY